MNMSIASFSTTNLPSSCSIKTKCAVCLSLNDITYLTPTFLFEMLGFTFLARSQNFRNICVRVIPVPSNEYVLPLATTVYSPQ
ncbi:hypothetical protein BCVP_CDS0215 [Bacillus phage BC-VP]|nr:hypothetical protein BCVP_CDS0215 [Bacillus phage BC-VP]